MPPLDSLACDCEDCGRPLDPADRQLVVTTPDGERRAYECRCGAVTVTVARS